jgi:hypothetical protein
MPHATLLIQKIIYFSIILTCKSRELNRGNSKTLTSSEIERERQQHMFSFENNSQVAHLPIRRVLCPLFALFAGGIYIT